jgi:hypothetical protein
LALFDTVWVLSLAAPSRADWSDRCALGLIGAPFHAVLAAGAGASPGHAAALALTAASFGGVASVVALRAAHAARVGAVFAGATFGLPTVAYACGEFLSVDVGALFRASPLTGPVLLARSCTDAGVELALPAVVAAALWLAVALTVRPASAQVST